MSTTMSEILQNSEIVFQTENTELYHEMPPDQKFGILRINIKPQESPITQKIAMIFTIDCSASMTEYCSDNRTKLDHAKHTMVGILSYLAEKYTENPHQDVFVSVVAFSKNIYHIFDFTKITPENLDEYIAKIQKIKTKDCTNIENALKIADEKLMEYLSKNPSSKLIQMREDEVRTHLYHIQLTDGEVTDGECDHDKLANMVNPLYNNIFVGFGKKHDDELLCKLSENPRNEYRFIDKIEYSSVVYGEILYNILYRAFDSIEIHMLDSEIYNWRTNTWDKTLAVNNLAYDSEHIFQIRTASLCPHYDVEAVIQSIDADTSSSTTIYCYPDLVGMQKNGEPNDYIRDDPRTLMITKYSFRQKTQELLYEVRSYIQNKNAEKNMQCQQKHDQPQKIIFTNTTEDDKNFDFILDPSLQQPMCIKDEHSCTGSNSVDLPTGLHHKITEISEKKKIYNKCQEFIHKIKTYMEEKNLKNDRTLKLLQDDIYIILNTIDNFNANMWCTIRQQSLGQNYSYQPTDFTETVDFGKTIRKPRLHRSQCGTYPLFEPDAGVNDDEVLSAQKRHSGCLFAQQTDDLLRTDANGSKVGRRCLNTFGQDDDFSTTTTKPYELSQNFDFNTMSPSMARTITTVARDASQNLDTPDTQNIYGKL